MKTTYEDELNKIDIFLNTIKKQTREFGVVEVSDTHKEYSSQIIRDFCSSFEMFLQNEVNKHDLHKQLRQAREIIKSLKKGE